MVPGVYGRFYGGALQNQLIYLSVLTSSGSSIPKFSKPNNEYHVQDRPRPCLTYVHFGIKNISLLHPFRLYALYINPKQAIPLSLLLLWMNLHVQTKSPRPDGSFVILHSNIGRKLNNWELFWCWFKCDLFSRHFGVPASCSKPSIFHHCPRYHFIVICHAYCYLQTQSTSAPPTCSFTCRWSAAGSQSVHFFSFWFSLSPVQKTFDYSVGWEMHFPPFEKTWYGQ